VAVKQRRAVYLRRAVLGHSEIAGTDASAREQRWWRFGHDNPHEKVRNELLFVCGVLLQGE
jgi:hypothetical protein